MPELHFTEGDTALIYVHNQLKTETSIHWHGLILPNAQDGVPYLTTAPIQPNAIHEYKFPLVQNGTYWYHSHTKLQEQMGMYGAFIIHKRDEEPVHENTIILSDWTNLKPSEVHRMLHNANDWFAIKKAREQKGAAQTYADAIREKELTTKITNEWKRMLAMDVSDIYYDAFFVNGKKEQNINEYRKGDKIRLRIINGSSSSYFWLSYAGGKITVVATDGKEVEPVEVDRLIIAVAETYDVEITLPDEGSFEFRATSEDRIGSTSLWVGTGIHHPATRLKPLYFFEGMKMMNGMMLMNGTMDNMGMDMSLQQMDMNSVMYPELDEQEMNMEKMDHASDSGKADNRMVTLNYSMLKSGKKTTLPEGPLREFNFELTGNMNRYVWSINNRTVSETDKILIRKGENVRLILYNNSMMRHPMHLHGHFFRVVNGQGEYAPLKNVLDIMPMETDTIEFAATEDGDWFFHCHILYHMMSGMGRIFRYADSSPNPQIPNPKKALRKLFADDRKFHLMLENDFASNGNDGNLMYSNTRWQWSTEWRLGYTNMHGYEVENHFGRYIGRMQWFMPFVGYDWRYRMHEGQLNYQAKNLFGQEDTKDTRKAFSMGFEYTLPMLVKLEVEAFTNKTLLVQVSRTDIPVSKRIRMHLMYNSDKEYMIGIQYIVSRYFAVRTHYDSDMGFGFGLVFHY